MWVAATCDGCVYVAAAGKEIDYYSENKMRLKLNKENCLYVFDDGVEYAFPWIVEICRFFDKYMMTITREGFDDTVVKLWFMNVDELRDVLIKSYTCLCSESGGCSESDMKMLKMHFGGFVEEDVSFEKTVMCTFLTIGVDTIVKLVEKLVRIIAIATPKLKRC